MSADMDMAADQESSTPSAEARKPTNFMSLPLEIRNLIYEDLLEEEKAIHLFLCTIPFNAADRGEGGSELVRSIGGLVDKHRTRSYDPAIKKWVRKELRHSSILYLNKQIHREAEMVLYGNNSFVFNTTTALGKFVNKIGPQRTAYLRSICIQGWVKSTGRAALKSLSAAKRLRKLEIKHSCFCRKPQFGKPELSLEQIAQQMAPVFKSLLESYEDLEIKGSVWDVLSLYWDFRCSKEKGCKGDCPGLYHGDCRCVCGAVDEHSKEIVKEIIRLGKERLKIEE